MKQKNYLLVFMAVFALIGTAVLLMSSAATPSASIEPEDGIPSGNVGTTPDPTASSGQKIVFGSSARDYMLIKRAELMAKPVSGTGWDFVKSQADLSSWGTVNLSDINSKTQTKVLAGALVYARTGDTAYRDKVITYIKQACGTEDDNWWDPQLLNLARTLYGYVVAADLVSMPLSTQCNNGQTWQDFLSGIRTKVIPGNSRWDTLEKTAGDTSSGWGIRSLSSHLAVSYALGDTTAIQRDIDIYKRLLGDTSSPAPPFNPSLSYYYNGNGSGWDMTPTMQRGINPDVPGDPRSGALIEEAIRLTTAGSDSTPCCTVQSAGIGYQEEGLDGIFATYLLLKAHGVDMKTSQNNAIKRAFDFYITNGGPGTYPEQRYFPYAINHMYGTSYPTQPETQVYRQLSFGEWLFGN